MNEIDEIRQLNSTWAGEDRAAIGEHGEWPCITLVAIQHGLSLMCSKPVGHTGNHAAHGIYNEVLLTWAEGEKSKNLQF